MKKILYFTISIILLITSYIIVFNDNIILNLGFINIDFNNKLMLISPTLIFALFFFVLFLESSNKRIFFKCKICEELFTYNEVNKKQCPNCENEA